MYLFKLKSNIIAKRNDDKDNQAGSQQFRMRKTSN